MFLFIRPKISPKPELVRCLCPIQFYDQKTKIREVSTLFAQSRSQNPQAKEPGYIR
jgi:hypothetical protein